MAFVPTALLAAAVDGLRGKHPLGVVVLPAMLRAGVEETAEPDAGTPYGSGNELGLLEEFFRVPGGPIDRPYRAIWEADEANYWRDARYPGRTLQRMRTDRVKGGRAFFQKKATPEDVWGLRATCGSDLAGEGGGYPIRVADLAVWYGRGQDAADLEALIGWFKESFPIDQAGLLGTVYVEDYPSHYAEIPFGEARPTQTEYAEVLGSIPEPVRITQTPAELAAHLERAVAAAGFISAPGLLQRMVFGWVRGDLVILVGQPGTGKTKLAALIEEALREALGGNLIAIWLAVHPELDDADMIGYERLDGEPQLREFSRRVLLSEDPLGVHLVVLEEFNLAAVEAYLAPVLSAIQDPRRRVALPGGGEASLPIDALFLATCNSYLDEPETRLRLSYPTKRRSTVITMPNVLAQEFDVQGPSVIVTMAVEMIRQEHARVSERVSAGLGSSLDAARMAALASVTRPENFSEAVQEALRRLGEVLMSMPEGRLFFTMGILRDIALNLALAPRSEEEELLALGRAMADKVVHQLRGPKDRAVEFEAFTKDLPNWEELEQLLERMQSAPGDELLPLV